MRFEREIAARPLHPDIINPVDESPGPILMVKVSRNVDSIKGEHGFYLILAPGLLFDHISPGSEQATILDLDSRGDIDPFEFPVSEAAGKLAAINLIIFACPFLVLCWDIGRVYDYAFLCNRKV